MRRTQPAPRGRSTWPGRCALAPVLVACCAAAGLTGCGNSRTRAPDLTGTVTPTGFAAFSDPASGLRLLAPQGWSMSRGQAPEVLSMISGQGVVAVWRYPRTEPLPATRAELTTASHALLRAVLDRDRSFSLGSRRVTRLGGQPAVQLVGEETIAGVRRKVRSTHVYFAEAEIVFDAYAPPQAFRDINRTTFVPLLRSVRLSRPV